MMQTFQKRKSDTTEFSSSGEQASLIPPATAFEEMQLIDPRWKEIMDTLVSFSDYKDDWDGMGSVAPKLGVLASAIALATLLRNSGHPAPDGVGPTVDGTICFDTGPFPIECLEVMTPSHAELWRGGEFLGEFEIQ